MSSQLSLVYRPAVSGHDIWERRIEILRTAVEHLGRKEVAWELNVSGSTLSDALNERDRKRWAAEWLDVLKQMLLQKGDQTAVDLFRRLADLDVEGSQLVIDERIELTADEEAIAYRRELEKTESGKAFVARMRKRGGRR